MSRSGRPLLFVGMGDDIHRVSPIEGNSVYVISRERSLGISLGETDLLGLEVEDEVGITISIRVL